VSDDVARVRIERDLFLRLLELGAKDELRPFLVDALALIVAAVGAKKGYIELSPRFSIASGLAADEIEAVRQAISRGIIGEALATGRTISTASAVDDPRFAKSASVQAQRLQAVLCAPIGDPSIGVLYFEGRERPGPFPEEARALAELFARHMYPLADRLLSREESLGDVDHTAPLRAKLAVSGIAGKSRALAEAFRLLSVAAQAPLPVLFTGESGTGKSAFARVLHESSARAAGPFVEVNCAAIPETLFESELFGAEKGAHSTATRRIEGKIDAASRGTLFLDEVGELPPTLQGKFLLFLQTKRYSRLGGTAAIDADVRVVAATNADIEGLVKAKRFREDLYYRLNVLEIRVPPLRARREDVGPVAEALLDNLARAHAQPMTLTRAARRALEEGEWPGNVRQLENVLARGWAIALSESTMSLEPRHLFPDKPPESIAEAEDETYEEATRRFQRTFLQAALAKYGWNVSETARKVGVARSHLNDLIRAHGLARAKR
jgi:DNA-binding NtrC family response regulator